MHNPYNYHVAVRNDAMFFGREEILVRLVNGLKAPIPLSAAIFGGRRCGKTSLLSKLARLLSEDTRVAGERRFVPCNLDLQRGRPLTSSDDFFLWILEELGETCEIQQNLERGLVVEALQTCYRREVAKGPIEAFVHAFRSLDKRLGSKRIRLVILIDESEQILTVKWSDDLRPNLRALLSNSPIVEDVALVMAGSTQMYAKVTEHDSPLENILDRYLLSTLSHEAILALARRPNNDRLSKEVSEEVWCQTGGQPCMAQYILHELWEELEGELRDATVEDIQDIAETFDDRTRHFSTWAKTLGKIGNDVYRFLAEKEVAVTYTVIRQQFSQVEIIPLQSTLDALLYHGLIHCYGRGRRREYSIAGQMYRSWFLSAGRLGPTEQVGTAKREEDSIDARLKSAIHINGSDVTIKYSEKEVTDMSKSIKFGNGATVSGNIVIADKIKKSFNTIGSSNASDNLKKLLKDLTASVSKMCEELPQEKAEQVTDDLETLTKEATKKKPRKKWWELSVEGIKDAATSVGEIGKTTLMLLKELIPFLEEIS